MPLTDLYKLKSWGAKALSGTQDDLLRTLIEAAEDWIVGVTGRVVEQTSYTRYFSDREIAHLGQRLYLYPGHRPVWHDGTRNVAVWIDGTALTVGVDGGAADKDAYVIGANEDRSCRIDFEGGWGGGGANNVKVTYVAGWAETEVPPRVTQLANEIALLIFKQPGMVGLSSASRSRGSVSITQHLSPISLATLDQMTVL